MASGVPANSGRDKWLYRCVFYGHSRCHEAAGVRSDVR
jgi:hypothetical protein